MHLCIHSCVTDFCCTVNFAVKWTSKRHWNKGYTTSWYHAGEATSKKFHDLWIFIYSSCSRHIDYAARSTCGLNVFCIFMHGFLHKSRQRRSSTRINQAVRCCTGNVSWHQWIPMESFIQSHSKRVRLITIRDESSPSTSKRISLKASARTSPSGI